MVRELVRNWSRSGPGGLIHSDDGVRGYAQVNLDLAWAQAHRRRDAEATLYLLEAERAAPEMIRYNAQVGDLLREILARSRRPSSVLHDLSVRAGALD